MNAFPATTDGYRNMPRANRSCGQPSLCKSDDDPEPTEDQRERAILELLCDSDTVADWLDESVPDVTSLLILHIGHGLPLRDGSRQSDLLMDKYAEAVKWMRDDFEKWGDERIEERANKIRMENKDEARGDFLLMKAGL